MTFFETQFMLGQPQRVYLLGNKFLLWVWLKKGRNITTLGFKRLTQQGVALLNLEFLKKIVPTQFTTIFHVTLRHEGNSPLPTPNLFIMDQCVRVWLFLLIACVRGNESFTVSKSVTLITLQVNAHIGKVCNFELDLTTQT